MGDDLREVLDEMSYGMISYLESHEYVARLDIEASTPISELSIRKWEKVRRGRGTRIINTGDIMHKRCIDAVKYSTSTFNILDRVISLYFFPMI